MNEQATSWAPREWARVSEWEWVSDKLSCQWVSMGERAMSRVADERAWMSEWWAELARAWASDKLNCRWVCGSPKYRPLHAGICIQVLSFRTLCSRNKTVSELENRLYAHLSSATLSSSSSKFQKIFQSLHWRKPMRLIFSSARMNSQQCSLVQMPFASSFTSKEPLEGRKVVNQAFPKFPRLGKWDFRALGYWRMSRREVLVTSLVIAVASSLLRSLCTTYRIAWSICCSLAAMLGWSLPNQWPQWSTPRTWPMRTSQLLGSWSSG